MRIRRLDPTLANQIAAGEVVERPASVVKELVENSLDADAHRVELEVQQGGMRLVRVRDDGVGIHRDDLLLALNRHATSKIRTAGDLQRVSTLGFRGEALPSIASVSRFELSSCIAEASSGWRVRADGSAEIRGPEPTGHARGTTVVVRDLFFNTPARRKFLRTEKTEYRHVEAVARALALSRYDVAVTVVHNQRQALRLAAASDESARTARVAKVCGSAFIEHALAVSFEAGDLRLHGWIASPHYTRRQADLQHLFVNGRAVRDATVRHAVRQAYEGRLGADRQPAYVLYLELDAAALDVNVHPTKAEVRFREARLVHDFVSRRLRGALNDSATLPGFEPVDAIPATPPPMAHGSPGASAVREQFAAYRELHAGSTGPGAAAPSDSESRLGRVLGHLGGIYAIATTADGLALIHLRAARTEVIARRMRTMLEAGTPRPRPVLVPEHVEVTSRQADCIERHAESLARLGFDLRCVAPERAALNEVPAAMVELGAAPIAAALLAALTELEQAEASEPLAEACDLLERVLVRCDPPGPGDLSLGGLEQLLRELESDPGALDSGAGRVWTTISREAVGALFSPPGG